MKKFISVIMIGMLVAGCVTSCKSGDPIVNPGVNNNANGSQSKDGYVPWWVEDKVPNQAGKVVGQ